MKNAISKIIQLSVLAGFFWAISTSPAFAYSPISPERLSSEIDEFFAAGAAGYLYWQYSGDIGTGIHFANDRYSFFRNQDPGICLVLKEKSAAHPGKFIGVNMWDIGNPSHSEGKVREHLEWLNNNCGVTVVRTFAKAGGADGVRKSLRAAEGTGVKLIIAIGDYSNGGGEMPLGANKQWYESGYKTSFRPFAQAVTDSARGSGALFGFELGNEVHCNGDATALEAYKKWGEDIVGILRTASSNVGFGQKASENTTKCDSPGDGSFKESNSISGITMTSAHYYNASEKALSFDALGQSGELGKLFYIGEAAWGGSLPLPAGGLEWCEGPIDIDVRNYRGQVIGHQDPDPDEGKGPWRLIVSATDDKENKGDLVTAVIADRLRVKPAPAGFQHTDFSVMTHKYIGALSPGSDDFIEDKVDGALLMEGKESMSTPIYLANHIPGYVQRAGYEIPAQNEIQPTETYLDFQARAYPSHDGLYPGIQSSFDDKPYFIGCLQSSVCDPRFEDKCLKNDKSLEFCDDTDTAENCIGVGRILEFSAEAGKDLKFIEPQELQAMNKVLWDFSTSIAYRPGDSLPSGRESWLANSMEDYYAALEQEPDNLANQVTVTSQPTASNTSVNPVSPNKAYARPTPPYKETQDYCSGAHILIENKREQNQYSVKVWNGQPTYCGGNSDWGYHVEYYLGGELIGGCHSERHKAAGLPHYNPDGSAEEKWGIPVDNLLGCSISITPREVEKSGKEFGVVFRILNSGAPNPETVENGAGCVQNPFCECPAESECGIVSAGELPPVDCSVCETWAPSGECATMEAEDLLAKVQCAEGYCDYMGTSFELADSDKIEDETVRFSVANLIGSWASQLAAWLGGSDDKIFNLHCDRKCVSEDPFTGSCLKHEWECTWGEKQYLLYGYVPSMYQGKLNLNRTYHDFKSFNATGLIPGINENFFEPQNSKHVVGYELELNPVAGDNISGNKTPTCDNWLKQRLDNIFSLGGKDNTCIDAEIQGNSTRSMYIEYAEHYTQAGMYCNSEAMFSPPGEFPERDLEFCSNFLPELRGGTYSSLALESGLTPVSGSTINKVNNMGDLGVPSRLLTTILEIEGGGSNTACRRAPSPDTGTGPYQITDLTIQDITNEAERTDWNIKEWAKETPQSIYRDDGRCDFEIASELAARVLKRKAGVDYRNGFIGTNDFNAIRDALNGYYGQYAGYCSPTPDTENRTGWGKGISYCDYGLWRMGLTQFCENGTLSPSCDGIVEDEETVMNLTEPMESISPPLSIQKQLEQDLAEDMEKILTKYSEKYNLSQFESAEAIPEDMKQEFRELEKKYQKRYNL